MEEKYGIGEETAELIGPTEHHNRELVTKPQSYERTCSRKRQRRRPSLTRNAPTGSEFGSGKHERPRDGKLIGGPKERGLPKKTLGQTKSNKE